MTGLLVPTPVRASGGHRYNRAIVEHWPGPPPDVVQLAGPWPLGDGPSRTALAEALSRHRAGIVDGLVGAAHPDLIEDAVAAGRRVVLLIHMPLGNEEGLSAAEASRRDALERRSVAAASTVIATSRGTAADLARRHGRADVVVATPGVRPAPATEPHDPPHLIAVGALGPLKNQLAFVRALAAVADLPWRATVAGPIRDAAYAAAVADAAPSRVRFPGELDDSGLDRLYADADLLVHPSLAESWGMVVTEALAHGVPAIVGAGTGAEEALASGGGPGEPPPGVAVRPSGLADVLRRWLTDAGLRAEWRRRALAARPGLGSWDATAAVLASTIEAVASCR